MQNFEDFLKNSSERDRNFQVAEDKWLRLEQELNQGGKKRVLFWWLSGLGVFALALSGYFLSQGSVDSLGAFKIPMNLREEPIEDRIKHKKAEKEIATIQVREDEKQEKFSSKKIVESSTSNKSIDKTDPDKGKESFTILIPTVLDTTVEEVTEKYGVNLREEEASYISEKPKEVTKLIKPKGKNDTVERSKKRAKVYAYQETDYSLEVEQEVSAQGTSIAKIKPQKLPSSEWLKEKPKWMLRGNFAVLANPGELFLTYYSTEPILHTVPIDYIRSSGEAVKLYPDGTFVRKNKGFYNFYGVSINRYFNSQFGVKAGLIYQSRIRDNSSLADPINNGPNTFYFTNRNKEQSIIAEIGVQVRSKPFWKRFVGFVGISGFKVLGGKRETEQRAIQQSIQFEELEFRTLSTYGWDQGFFGLFVESSLQYRLSKDISLGPMYYTIIVPNAPVRLGYGFEVRYWW